VCLQAFSASKRYALLQYSPQDNAHERTQVVELHCQAVGHRQSVFAGVVLEMPKNVSEVHGYLIKVWCRKMKGMDESAVVIYLNLPDWARLRMTQRGFAVSTALTSKQIHHKAITASSAHFMESRT
jgi:hypothetical protein